MLDTSNKVLFFAGYGSATVLFYAHVSDITNMIHDIKSNTMTSKERAELREAIRQGFQSELHISEDYHDFNIMVALFFLSHNKYLEYFEQGLRGFALLINHISGDDYNFRTVIGSLESIRELSVQYRESHGADLILTGDQIKDANQ